MIKHCEILRLHAKNISNRGIASSCGCSKNTVSDVLKRTEEKGATWPFEKDVDDNKIQEILFPEKHKSDSRKYLI